ncbi:hypothetical protein ACOT81_07220 [Streptomyces sp. WI04-05B]|uniref:hypothetical protein n=1 Tax=Streptomyces TaxID=1883 RepID=UPI0029BB2F99|nr:MULTISPECIES: hypothetical protein [unclassified Streptomyces]MDX2549069.1 hypothetical protein [Streptomyces sp. WI04-05B]MDX2590478.1 hypothetical protein [Streptomyces sp. WI04-05A]MDX3752904.1 hypothetical protein [Streptomyces sp. AK08-02]
MSAEPPVIAISGPIGVVKAGLALADEGTRPPWCGSSVFEAFAGRVAPRRASCGGVGPGLAAGRSGGRSGGADRGARRCRRMRSGIGSTVEHSRHRHPRRAVVLGGLLGSARELAREAGAPRAVAPRLVLL